MKTLISLPLSCRWLGTIDIDRRQGILLNGLGEKYSKSWRIFIPEEKKN